MFVRSDRVRSRLAPTCLLFVLLALAPAAPAVVRPVELLSGTTDPRGGLAGPVPRMTAGGLEPRPIAAGSAIRAVVVRGVVEPLEKSFFGRPQRVAIVSIHRKGILVQNAVEDVGAGEALKKHVGEQVTALGAILVKADGSAALLVDSFEVHATQGEGGDG